MSDQAHSSLQESQADYVISKSVEQPTLDRSTGLIIVHGIGEQEPGDHLESVVRPLANAISERGLIVTIKKAGKDQPRTGPDATLMVAEKNATPGTSKLYKIGIHEVHWADINEENSLGKGIRFWFWGLSAWCLPTKKQSKTKMVQETLALPRFKDSDRPFWRFWKVRVPLLVTGYIFAIAAIALLSLEFVATRVFKKQLPVGLKTIMSYMSAVKLYSQARRRGAGHLESAAEPPRFTIRRRMVRTMVDAALIAARGAENGGYDRWGVLAHSMGTVVAFNGLMAASPALQAYLDDERLEKLKNAGMAGEWLDERDGPSPDTLHADRSFRPSIPAHRVGQNIVVYRDKLFANFSGFISYGSPLDKFAAIWPPTVSLNNDPYCFPKNCCWLNIYDPTDPVSASIDAFDNRIVFKDNDAALKAAAKAREFGGGSLEPVNIAYPASQFLLFSHVRYLKSEPSNGQSLRQGIADWVISGKLEPAKLARMSPKTVQTRAMSSIFQTVVVAAIFFVLTTTLVHMVLHTGFAINAVTGLGIDEFMKAFGITAIIVGAASAIGWFTTKDDVAEENGTRASPKNQIDIIGQKLMTSTGKQIADLKQKSQNMINRLKGQSANTGQPANPGQDPDR